VGRGAALLSSRASLRSGGDCAGAREASAFDASIDRIPISDLTT